MWRVYPVALACLAAVAACSAAAQTRPLPEDQVAYRAAMAQAEPAARLRALRAFSVNYGDSSYFEDAQEAALTLLLEHYPARIADIRDQVQVNVANVEKGLPRLQEEAREAAALADAGVLLPLAQRLAEDAVRNLTETAYTSGTARTLGQLQAALPAPAELRSGFVEARAAAVLALAAVELRQGRTAAAGALLDEAAHLQPRSSRLHALRSRMAQARGDTGAALLELEQAAVLGELSAAERQQLGSLWSQAHAGQSAAADLQADLDRRWRELNPPFTPATQQAIEPGHTALLELFTGTGCLPCAAADAAAEALAAQYPANVVLLQWDQHVPRPDPLTNPAGIARAEVLVAGSTPSFFLDGKRMPIYGGTRAQTDEVYQGLLRLLQVQAPRPMAVALRLSVALAGGTVRATVQVTAPDAALLRQAVAAQGMPWPGDSLAAAAQAHEAEGAPPQLVLNMALVENEVRFSGDNGVRFHRMVVRATSNPPAWGEPMHAGQTQTITTSFDLQTIRDGLSRYLESFSRANEWFGPVQLPASAVPLQSGQLGVVAWVQDTRTHRTVQAAYIPVVPIEDR